MYSELGQGRLSQLVSILEFLLNGSMVDNRRHYSRPLSVFIFTTKRIQPDTSED